MKLGEGKWGVQSTGVSQSVTETSRDESQSVPSAEKLYRTRDLKLPFLRDLSQVLAALRGIHRTFLHPY